MPCIAAHLGRCIYGGDILKNGNDTRKQISCIQWQRQMALSTRSSGRAQICRDCGRACGACVAFRALADMALDSIASLGACIFPRSVTFATVRCTSYHLTTCLAPLG